MATIINLLYLVVRAISNLLYPVVKSHCEFTDDLLMELYTLVGLLMKGSKLVHFTNEVVYIGGFTNEMVEVGTLY